MTTLRRARLDHTGWDEGLRLESDLPLPEPEAGQVLVELEASGVCHRDLLDREGRFPFLRIGVVPGHESVGRVIAVGTEVGDWQVGDRVATMHRDACGHCAPCIEGSTSLCQSAAFVLGIIADGTYASHVVAPQSAFYRVPDSLEAGAAAVLHCTFGTAYRAMVTLGRLKAGERVLITGANGGVGSAAVQVAKAMGAYVVAALRSDEHAEFVRGLGADAVVVSPENRFHDQAVVDRVDLVLDNVGEPTFPSALRSLRVGGRIVVVGNVTPARVSVNLGYLITYGITLIGSSGATRADMERLLALVEAHPPKFPIDRVVPLAEADAAQRAVRAGGLAGRIVLQP